MSERLEIDPEERIPPQPAAPRRRVVTALSIAAVIAGVGYASWWTYQSAKPPQAPSVVPEIHSDAAPVKEPPKNPGGMLVPDQDSALLNRADRKRPGVEQLLPEPEQALPRPVPAQPPTPPAPAAAPASTALGAAQSAQTESKTSAPVKPPLAEPPASTPASPPPLASPVPPRAPMEAGTPVTAPAASPAIAALPASPATRASSSSGYRLQLGAVRSEEAAKQEWQRLQKSQPAVLGKLGLIVARVDLGAKGVFYRIQAGPIAGEAEATQSCAALKDRKIGCILVKP